MDACRLVEVGGWLRWQPARPVTIGQGQPSRPSATPRRVGRRWRDDQPGGVCAFAQVMAAESGY